MEKSHKIIYSIYILICIIMAINPFYQGDWLLRNILIFILFPFVLRMDRIYKYTTLSMVLLLIFASLYSIGSRYTYIEMEYFDVISQFLGFDKNNFDRIVHFLFGLLLFRILFEMIIPNVTTVKTTLIFTFSMIISISIIYEVIEWLTVLILYPELEIAFVGIEGDVWDAHKDSLAAATGGLLNIFFYKNYNKLWELKKYTESFSPNLKV